MFVNLKPKRLAAGGQMTNWPAPRGNQSGKAQQSGGRLEFGCVRVSITDERWVIDLTLASPAIVGQDDDDEDDDTFLPLAKRLSSNQTRALATSYRPTGQLAN